VSRTCSRAHDRLGKAGDIACLGFQANAELNLAMCRAVQHRRSNLESSGCTPAVASRRSTKPGSASGARLQWLRLLPRHGKWGQRLPSPIPSPNAAPPRIASTSSHHCRLVVPDPSPQTQLRPRLLADEQSTASWPSRRSLSSTSLPRMLSMSPCSATSKTPQRYTNSSSPATQTLSTPLSMRPWCVLP